MKTIFNIYDGVPRISKLTVSVHLFYFIFVITLNKIIKGFRIPDVSKYFCSLTPTNEKTALKLFFHLSECRDSNPDRMLPKHECYRYTTLRYNKKILAQNTKIGEKQKLFFKKII